MSEEQESKMFTTEIVDENTDFNRFLDYGQTVMNVCSPVMDLTTDDIWRLFAATDWEVSDIYEKMHEAGIAIENQRTGSLLNYSASKHLDTVRSIEPQMYAKITARFQNIDMMANFGPAGYYKIGRPQVTPWNGRNHIKAGQSNEYNKALADLYEKILKQANIDYKRVEDEFHFEMKKGHGIKRLEPLKGLSNMPIKNTSHITDDMLEAWTNGDIVEGQVPLSASSVIGDPKDLEASMTDEDKLDLTRIPSSMLYIDTTWKDYALYMLNTTKDPLRTIWQEKMVTSILSWKYSAGSVNQSTIDALSVMTELPDGFTDYMINDHWDKTLWNTFGKLAVSKKIVLALEHYPEESLEKEAQVCLLKLLDLRTEKSEELLKSSPTFMRLAEEWNSFGGKSMTPLNYQKMTFGAKDYDIPEKIDNPPEIFSEAWYKNMKAAILIWFKEEIHSTSSWKRFLIAVNKGDPTLKYIGFGQTSRERMLRAKAISAFEKENDKKEKAKKEADMLAKKIAKEAKENAKN